MDHNEIPPHFRDIIGQQEQAPPGVGAKASADEVARRTIPTRDSLKTKYKPVRNLLMVIPLPSMTMHGALHLPDRSQLPMNEGHVVDVGPACSGEFKPGDCVLWDPNAEFRLNIDDSSKFVLINEPSIIMKIDRKQLEMELELWKKKEPSGPDKDII